MPPPGFHGHGQDTAWARTTFPEHYDTITNIGYTAWLADYIGHNEPNGRYQVKITIDPTAFNQQTSQLSYQPTIYLVCGPYKMVVPGPGTYCFPLEVFETYKVRTYPQRLPLTFAYDDGFDDDDFEPSYTPRAARAATQSTPPEDEFEYDISKLPRFKVTPQTMWWNDALGQSLTIRCNVSNPRFSYTSTWGGIKLTFLSMTEAEVTEAALDVLLSECVVDITLTTDKGSCTTSVVFRRRDAPYPGSFPFPDWWPTNIVDDVVSTNTPPRVESTNDTTQVTFPTTN